EDKVWMNNPLKFESYTLYQAGYHQNDFSSMSFKIHESNVPDQEALETIKIDLTSTKNEYEFESGLRVVMDKYYPDYYLDNVEPRSKSKHPNNPAFVMFVYPPNTDSPEISFIGIGKNIDATGENKYKL